MFVQYSVPEQKKEHKVHSKIAKELIHPPPSVFRKENSFIYNLTVWYRIIMLLILKFPGAMVVEHPASIEDGFVSNTPLVYNYGHLDINENPALYNLLISKTADKIFQRIRNNKAGNYFLLIYIS